MPAGGLIPGSPAASTALRLLTCEKGNRENEFRNDGIPAVYLWEIYVIPADVFM